MKVQSQIKFSLKIDEKEYVFTCEDGAPLGQAWDALTQIRSVVAENIKAQDKSEETAQEEQKEAEDE